MGKGDDHPTSLLLPSSSSKGEFQSNHLRRTGGLWNAVAHIITAVIGSGVLSLAWSMAQLGWIAGPVTMLFFALVTIVTAFFLCDAYRSPDPEYGHIRNRSYLEAVRLNLGKRCGWTCGLLVYISFYGYATAYIITSESSMRAIQKSNCYHREGQKAACDYGDSTYMLLFGIVQVVMSQIPNFHEIDWLSVVAAIMSCTYSSIGLGLGLAKTIGNGEIKGSISGVATSTAAEKVWLVSQALGDIAFAFPYCIIILEIQDTLKSPPSESQTMKKASMIAVFTTTLFYLLCGGFGYAAFGDDTPGNLLTGFRFYGPHWLVDFANACIVLHLVGGYQILSQPLFAAIDRYLENKYPESGFINNNYNLKLPILPSFPLNLYRICFRTVFVASTTGIAMLFPYFNQVLGVLGALFFWPLTIYFPVELYLVQKKIAPWTKKWILLNIFSIFCLLLALFAVIGSVEGVIAEKQKVLAGTCTFYGKSCKLQQIWDVVSPCC